MRRFAIALVAAVALAAVVVPGCSTLTSSKPPLPPPTQTAEGVTFRFSAPSARVVQLAGNWTENNWLAGQAQTGTFLVGEMKDDDGDGIWTRTELLSPGRVPVQVRHRPRELEGRSQQSQPYRRRLRWVQLVARRPMTRAPSPGCCTAIAAFALSLAFVAGGCSRNQPGTILAPTGIPTRHGRVLGRRFGRGHLRPAEHAGPRCCPLPAHPDRALQRHDAHRGGFRCRRTRSTTRSTTSHPAPTASSYVRRCSAPIRAAASTWGRTCSTLATSRSPSTRCWCRAALDVVGTMPGYTFNDWQSGREPRRSCRTCLASGRSRTTSPRSARSRPARTGSSSSTAMLRPRPT